MRVPPYSADEATVQALRSDVALQLGRYAAGLGITQVAAAKQLGLPQLTLSQITNGLVSDLSLELLDARSVYRSTHGPLNLDLLRAVTRRFGRDAADILEQVLAP